MLSSVQIWRFGDEAGSSDGGDADADASGSWMVLDEASSLVGGTQPCGLPAARLFRHARFPQDFFTVCPNWSRKGFMHVRWCLDGVPTDLVNVHLFHDDSNLTALQRSAGTMTESLSVFAAHRLRALRSILHGLGRHKPPTHHQHMPEGFVLGGGGGGVGGVEGVPTAAFLFGDFNFRLDQRAVVRHLCGEEGLAAAAAAAEPSGGGGALRLPGGAASDVALEIDAKQFRITDVPALLASRETLRSYDHELGQLHAEDEVSRLSELPVGFMPTYMRAAAGKSPKAEGHDVSDPDKAAAAAALQPASYGSKRCPAWTDRILMDSRGWAAAGGGSGGGDAEYGSRPQATGAIACDHDMVFLALTLRPPPQ